MDERAATDGEEMVHPRRLPVPPDLDAGVAAAEGWVRDQLAELATWGGETSWTASRRFRGGQRSADVALAALDLTGYAAQRNEVSPTGARGATGLSPYVRHGLLDLPLLWRVAADAPASDRDRFRDELLWQEFARHTYARLGARTVEPLRHEPLTTSGADARVARSRDGADPWEEGRRAGMVCLTFVLDELNEDGWLVNQTRMWMASHWAVRGGADWERGEDLLYRQLIDGSRAANRLGWQWTVGTATGKPYAFSRWQVERRAPGLCASCPLNDACPLEGPPAAPTLVAAPPEPLLRHDPDADTTAGPRTIEADDPSLRPEAVWITAESLGDEDPALLAHPDLPAVFVFDLPLLARLALHPRRLVFLAESLGDLATRRPVEVWRGDIAMVLGRQGPATRPLAATFAPVPGWRRRSAALPVVERHPWPWLRRPGTGKVTSFSAWRGRTPERDSGHRNGRRSERHRGRRGPTDVGDDVG